MQPQEHFRLLTRSRGGFAVHSVATGGAAVQVELPMEPGIIGLEYCADAAVLALLHTSSFAFVRPGAWAARVNVTLPAGTQLVNLHLSPKGSYAAVLVRAPHTEQATANNILIYETSSGKQLHGFQQRLLGRETPLWPLLTWSADEAHWARVVTNEVQFGVAADLIKIIARIKEDRVRQAHWAPAGPPRIALLSAEDRAHALPARLRVFAFPPSDNGQVLSQLNLFRADESSALWAPVTASALLAVTHTEMDPSGKSYYGETKLFQVQAAEPEGGPVEGKEGPLHAYAWAPNGKHFTIIAGRMPARVSCFNRRGQLTLDLCEGPYNTIAWSSCSRLLMMGGLGNVKGPIAVWDVGKTRRLCEIHTTATTFAFSPSARILITAVLYPRLKVENGFRLWSYDGRLLHTLAFDAAPNDQLFQACFLPVPNHHEPPMSPRLYTGEAAAAAAPAASQPAAPAKYRHPNAAASTIQREEPIKLEPKKYKPPPARGKEVAAPSLPPGAELVDGGKKKTRRRKKGGAGGAADGNDANTPDEWDAEEAEPASPTPAAAVANPSPAAAAAATLTPAAAGGESIGEVEKKVKAMQKKVRQIAQLRADAASAKALNPDQQSKLAGEAAAQAELAALEGKLAGMHAALLKSVAAKP